MLSGLTTSFTHIHTHGLENLPQLNLYHEERQSLDFPSSRSQLETAGICAGVTDFCSQGLRHYLRIKVLREFKSALSDTGSADPGCNVAPDVAELPYSSALLHSPRV